MPSPCLSRCAWALQPACLLASSSMSCFLTPRGGSQPPDSTRYFEPGQRMEKNRQVPLALVPPLTLKLPWLLPADNPQRWFVCPTLPLSSWAFLGPNSSSHGWVGAVLRDRHCTLVCFFFFLGRRGELAVVTHTFVP